MSGEVCGSDGKDTERQVMAISGVGITRLNLLSLLTYRSITSNKNHSSSFLLANRWSTSVVPAHVHPTTQMGSNSMPEPPPAMALPFREPAHP
jgi:hypothetical protein